MSNEDLLIEDDDSDNPQQQQDVPEPESKPKQVQKKQSKFNWDNDIDLSGKAKCILCIGACGKGKSVAIKYILLKNLIDRKFFQFGLVFTNTKFSNEYDFLPEKYVIEGYNQEILEKYLDKLKKYKKKHGEVPPNFVLFEDMIGILNTKHDPFLINFFGSHRHLSCCVIMATQHLNTGSSTLLREVTTHCLAWGSRQMNTMEGIWLNFGQLFEGGFNHFKKNFLDITKEKYSAMLYLQENDDIDNNYFTFKAPDMTKYKKIQVQY